MAATFRWFCSWLTSSLAIISLAFNTDVQSQFTYNGFHGANLLLDGIAEIRPNGLLQLTNTSKQQLGHAFHPSPIKFNGSYAFSTNFVFAMVPELQNISGHGIAFVISPSTDFSHAVESQYLGLFNTSNNGLSSNHILAIEFDTIRSPDFNDINDNHVGIDVNSLESIQSTPVAYFSNEENKNRSLGLIHSGPIQVWIDYDEVEKLLNVTLAPLRSPKPQHPLLSTPIDLSDIVLDTVYVGFSAATGAIASKHYILGWSFNISGQAAQSLEISELPRLPRGRRSGVKELFLDRLIIILIAFILLVAICIAAYLYRRKKYGEVREDWEKEYGPQRFTYKSLCKATKGFKSREILGEGGFGKVYRGTVSSSNAEIAVKRVSHDSEQGLKQFVAEVASLGRLRHRNLVRLLGYSRRRGELLLVYDYMPNGSLDNFLFCNEKPNLSWSQRLQIIKGVALALLYLHEEWEQVVVHRDIKASNVLLDAEMNGRLGDFGLARAYDHGANPQTTQLVGTLGYMAPELTRIAKATTSSDVYAFGVLLLEVACGRKPIEPQGLAEEVFLVDWVSDCCKRGAILDGSDPRLEGVFEKREMELVLKLGLLCCQRMPEARPTMRQVVQYLDGNADLLLDINEPEEAVNIDIASLMINSYPSSVGNGSPGSPHSWSSADSVLHRGR